MEDNKLNVHFESKLGSSKWNLGINPLNYQSCFAKNNNVCFNSFGTKFSGVEIRDNDKVSGRLRKQEFFDSLSEF